SPRSRRRKAAVARSCRPCSPSWRKTRSITRAPSTCSFGRCGTGPGSRCGPVTTARCEASSRASCTPTTAT
ncbi:unnamed protein product, partial [Ixodes persulcatus]